LIVSDFDKLIHNTSRSSGKELYFTITLTVYDKNDKVYANGNKKTRQFSLFQLRFSGKLC